MTGEPTTDAEVHAYLDGELGVEERERLERAVAADPALGERLASYRRTDHRLRTEFDAIAQEAIPEPMLAALFSRPAQARRRYLPALAAGIAMFVAGAFAGGLLLPNAGGGRSDAEAAARYAIEAHRVFAAEVRHPVEVGADQRDHLVAWLSNRLGQPLSAPDLAGAGFQLIGGRLLPGEDSLGAQFMYENDAKDRVTLYVSKNLKGGQTAFKLTASGDLHTFYWLDGPLGYAITGAISESALLALAHSAYDQLTKPGEAGAGRKT